MQLPSNETWLEKLTINVLDFQTKISHLEPNSRLAIYELLLKQANSGPMTTEVIKRFLLYRKIKRFSDEKLTELLEEFAELVPNTKEYILKDLIHPITSLFVFRIIRDTLGAKIANLPKRKRDEEFTKSCLYPAYNWFINGLYSVYNFSQVIDLYTNTKVQNRIDKISRIDILSSKDENFAAEPVAVPSKIEKSADTNINSNSPEFEGIRTQKETRNPVTQAVTSATSQSPQAMLHTWINNIITHPDFDDKTKLKKIIWLCEDHDQAINEDITPKLFNNPSEALKLFKLSLDTNTPIKTLLDGSVAFNTTTDITEE